MSIDEREEKRRKVNNMLNILEIPCSTAYVGDRDVSSLDLYDILTDDEKLKVLISKLRNKAFW